MMNHIDEGEITEFFHRVSSWPEESRRLLVTMIERRLAGEWRPLQSDGPSIGLHGLFRTDGPPPTDEEVDRMLHDERMRRYGS